MGGVFIIEFWNRWLKKMLDLECIVYVKVVCVNKND